MPTINEAGLELVKNFEGLYLHAYQDSVGVWTIGYGHTRGVYQGQVITENEALVFLQSDMIYAETQVQAFANRYGVTMTPNQFSALTSLVFNVGSGCLVDDTRLSSALRSHNFTMAADDILAYDHAGGRVLFGLQRRRMAERQLFLTPEK